MTRRLTILAAAVAAAVTSRPVRPPPKASRAW